jgi:hypothetical protein
MNKKCKYIILMAALLSSTHDTPRGEMFILKKHLAASAYIFFSQTGVCNGALFLSEAKASGLI